MMMTMRRTERDLAPEISRSVPVYIGVEQEENDDDDDEDDGGDDDNDDDAKMRTRSLTPRSPQSVARSSATVVDPSNPTTLYVSFTMCTGTWSDVIVVDSHRNYWLTKISLWIKLS